MNQTENSADGYLAAWEATADLVESGHNWSGNERNVAFLNTRDGRFAGVSALTGFDSPADGRGMALVDWDHDGDLDLWITQRTAPRLRFLRNDNHSAAKSLRIQLQSLNGNRHGIGSRVEVVDAAGQRQVRTLRAGEGYLAQSSQSLHFGLGTDGSVSSIKVRWPNGQNQSWTPPANATLLRLTQNEAEPTSLGSPRIRQNLIPSKAPDLPAPKVSRMIPHSPLPLPTISYVDKEGTDKQLTATGRRKLIVLWATWCLPCVQELTQLNRHQENLSKQGLDILPLNLDDLNKPSSERMSTVQRMWRRQNWTLNSGLATSSLMEIADAARETILGRQWTWSIPCSLLLDEENRLLAFYEGSPTLDTLTSDTQTLFRQGHDRQHAVPYAGRWYVEPYPPDHLALATILGEKKRFSDLADYLAKVELIHPGEKERASLLCRNAAMEASTSDVSLAEELFNEAIRLAPHDTEHPYARAMFFQSSGRFKSAMADYRRVLEMDAEHLRATAALGWLLATAPEPELLSPSQAIQLARKACEQTGNQAPETLDVLAAAYAADGQFDLAIRTAQRALQHLPSGSQQTTEIQQRVKGYRQKKAFTLPAMQP
jgi:tetratricopeptide (TPR) repeat protein